MKILVLEVLPGGQGERVGLRKGDVVTSYAGQNITETGRLNRLVAASTGSNVELAIRRDGKPLTLKVGAGKLGVRFEERSVTVLTPENH